jgi:hypothetical protein
METELVAFFTFEPKLPQELLIPGESTGSNKAREGFQKSGVRHQ